MNEIGTSFDVRQEQGFSVHVLSNSKLEIAVVPELGGKIISIKNLETGREWMWHPAGGMKLFLNHFGDDFSNSPLVGVDECLPTIARCTWQGRNLPDHGELWTSAWDVDGEQWRSGVIKTRVSLKVSPFVFHRTIALLGNEILLSYQLDNKSHAEEPYLWAMHPLLDLKSGDRLELPASTRALINGEAWIHQMYSAVPEGGCIKAFARPVSEGFAGIVNSETGDRIELIWDAHRNNTLGLWLTRGGWHGHHHFAMEPTNGDNDALSVVASGKECGIVPASGFKTWQVSIRVGP